MGELRKKWVAGKAKFESLKIAGIDTKKVLSKKDLGPLLDQLEQAYKAMLAEDDKAGKISAKTAKPVVEAGDAAVKVIGVYDGELKALAAKVSANASEEVLGGIGEAREVLGGIVLLVDRMSKNARDVARKAPKSDTAPIRKAVEKSMDAALAALKKCEAKPSAANWNAVMQPALALLAKATDLSAEMAREVAPGLAKHKAKKKESATEKEVATDLKDVRARLKALAGKLDTYVPKS